MKYMGSKNRIAKHLLPIILKDRKEGQWFVDTCVGGANLIDKVDEILQKQSDKLRDKRT